MPGWTPGPGPPKAGPCGGPASRWLGRLGPRPEASRCGQGKASRWKMLVGSGGHLSGVWREWNGGRAERTRCPTGCSWWRKRTALRARHRSAGTSLGENRGRRVCGTGARRPSAGAGGSDKNTALGEQVRREVLPSCPGLRVWDQVGKAREWVEEGVCAQSLGSGGSRRRSSVLGPLRWGARRPSGPSGKDRACPEGVVQARRGPVPW